MRREIGESVPGARPRAGADPSRTVPITFVMLAFVVAFVVGGRSVTERIHAAKLLITTLESRVREQDDLLSDIQRRTLDRIAESEDRTADLLVTTTKPLAQVQDRLVASVQDQQVEFAASLSQQRRIQDDLEVHVRDELVGMRDDFANLLYRALSRRVSEMEAFQEIHAKYESSVLLIHSTFQYRTRNEGGTDSIETGSGWGTGFVVTREGHILTNKHVVQPWKFDPEIRAMEAIGEVEVLENSLRLAAWPSGTPCMDAERNLRFDVGFNGFERNNLRLAAIAPDAIVSRRFDVAGAKMEYPIHDLNDNDLALLKADGATFLPIPMASRRESVHKLDRVMALGFPRGKSGLETELATTSPSVGTVRKAENTIHVTAPIIPGNSGGPLFDQHGEVIGIATRIYSETLGICLRIEHGRDLLESALRAEKATVAAKE